MSMKIEDRDSACPDPFRPFGKSEPGKMGMKSDFVMKAKEAIVRRLKQTDKPVFLGILAMEAHLDLARAHIIINDMVASGTIRQASREEKRLHDIEWDAHAFTFVKGR